MNGVSADRSLPLQGGLPPTAVVAADVVEVACDESGFSGSNLLDPATPVFTHASVDLSVDEAEAVVETLLRHRSGGALRELKSGRLLRGPEALQPLEGLLSDLVGRAHVVVVDKEHFLATRVVDLFLAEPSYASGTRLTAGQRPQALALHRAGQSHRQSWDAFLDAFVDLVRTKRRPQLDRRVLDRFFRARDALALEGVGAEAATVLAGLTRTRVRAIVTRLHEDDRAIPPPLEPLLPALAETVLFWSTGGRPVLVVHDEQSALTPERLRRLQQVLAPVPASLAGLVTVDSRDDARVQVADLLAGLARRLPGEGGAGPLDPFLSPWSLPGEG